MMGPGSHEQVAAFGRGEQAQWTGTRVVAAQRGTQTGQTVAVGREELTGRHVGLAGAATWEGRLYAGLRVARIAPETRAGLLDALGEMGVEAEFFLLLVEGFPGEGRASRARGELFLLRLEAVARRLRHVAARLEVATQSFLTALEGEYPGVAGERGGGEVWWPTPGSYALQGEPLELRLRRCGFAYRHVVSAQLAMNVEAIAEYMALTLHALRTMPPAGVTPLTGVYQGLYELASGAQGYVAQRHIADASRDTPGLLTSVAWLRALDGREGSALEQDVAWARAQYAEAAEAARQRLVGAGGRGGQASARQWAEVAAHEWGETLRLLEGLRGSGV